MDRIESLQLLKSNRCQEYIDMYILKNQKDLYLKSATIIQYTIKGRFMSR